MSATMMRTPPDDTEIDIFISYNKEDERAVGQLNQRLTKEGFRVWWDKDMRPGSAWSDEINEAILRSKCCIVVVGAAGLGPSQQFEVNSRIARRVDETKGKYLVIPVLLPGAKLGMLPNFLAERTWVQFHKSFNETETFQRLVYAIKHHIGKLIANTKPDTAPNKIQMKATIGHTLVESSKILGDLLKQTQVEKRLRPDEAKALQLSASYSKTKGRPVDSALLLGAMLRLGGSKKTADNTESAFLNLLLKQKVKQTGSTSASYTPIELELLGLPAEYSSFLGKGTIFHDWLSVIVSDELASILSGAAKIAERTNPKSKAIHTRHLLGAMLAADPEEAATLNQMSPSTLSYYPSVVRQLQSLEFNLDELRRDFLMEIKKREGQKAYIKWQNFIDVNMPVDEASKKSSQPAAVDSQPRAITAESAGQSTRPKPEAKQRRVSAATVKERNGRTKTDNLVAQTPSAEPQLPLTQPDNRTSNNLDVPAESPPVSNPAPSSDPSADTVSNSITNPSPAPAVGSSSTTPPFSVPAPANPAFTYYDNRSETYVIGPPAPAAAKDKVSVYVSAERVYLWHNGQPYTSPNLIDSVELAGAGATKRYGELLFEGIIHGKGFEGENKGSTLEGYEQARRDNQDGFRLELWIDPGKSDLNALMWEYLKDPASDSRPLSLYEKSPFCRRVRSTKKNSIPANPLKILIAICNPVTLGQEVDNEGKPGNQYVKALVKIDVAQERDIIETALSRLEQAQVAEYEILDGSKAPVTLEAIREKIQEGYHILHLLAHGIFIGHDYYLVMENENRRHNFVSAESFRQTLDGHKLRLVMLAACQSASRGTGAALKGLGPSLVGEELPAVIAMQDEVKVETAQLFTQYFYDDLARTGRVDTAMAATRFALYQKNIKEWQWGIPVLFMSTDDGQLLNISKQKAAQLPELKPEVKSYDQLAGQGNPAPRKMAQAIESEARRYGAMPETLGALRAVVAPSLATARIEEEPLARPQDRDTLTSKLTERVRLDAVRLKQYVETEGSKLALPPSVYGQLASALNAGKHIILIGPPGTGKTSLAHDICQYAATKAHCATGVTLTTATADWTAFDTIGGYVPTAQQVLQFRPGIFLQAISSGSWLVIDEINRAEIDKAFGELFTVLSGQQADLPYSVGPHQVRVLPPADRDPMKWIPQNGTSLSGYDYVMHPNWRILATMNVYDKSSLFAMSFAFMRRFAFVDVDLPDAAIYDTLINRWADEQNLDKQQQNIQDMLQKLADLLDTANPLNCRALGPAIIKDMMWYIGNRLQFVPGEDPMDLLGEAFLLYVTPQLDGLDRASIILIHSYLQDKIFNGQTVIDSLQRRIRSLYPHIGSDDWKK